MRHDINPTMTGRKLKRQPVARFNMWDFDREAGDYVFHPLPEQECANIFVYRESTGKNKASSGELTPHMITKNGKPRRAELDDFSVWRWCD